MYLGPIYADIINILEKRFIFNIWWNQDDKCVKILSVWKETSRESGKASFWNVCLWFSHDSDDCCGRY
jgi:hypothetical protein